MASVHRTVPSDCKPDIARRMSDAKANRQAAIEIAIDYTEDGAVALWAVAKHRNISQNLRREIDSAIEQLRRVRGLLREVA